MIDHQVQEVADYFYQVIMKGKPCCSGCDWWVTSNALIGDCTKNAPVSFDESISLLGMVVPVPPCQMRKAGHIMTPREYKCGDFKDTYDWSSHEWPETKAKTGRVLNFPDK